MALLSWVLVASVGVPAPLLAQEDSRARAHKLFDAGLEHYDAGHYQVALTAFEQAYRSAPHPAVRVNIAGCFAKLGRPVEALFNYERFLEENQQEVDPAQYQEIRAAMANLEAQVGSVTLSIQPKDAQVRLDGKQPRPFPDGRVVTAQGVYQAEVFAHGYVPHRAQLVVRGGEQSQLRVVLLRESAPTSSTPVPSTTDQPALSTADHGDEIASSETSPAFHSDGWWESPLTRRLLLAGAVATGVTGTIAGARALGVSEDFDREAALSKNPSTPPAGQLEARSRGIEYADKADRLSTVADVMLVTTVVLGSAALVLWILSERADSPQVALAPSVRPSGGGMWLRGRF